VNPCFSLGVCAFGGASEINSVGKILGMTSFGNRVAGTIIVGVCWLAFLLFFLAFFAGNFDLLQDIAIFFVSIIVAIGIVAVMWIKWTLAD
jgi:hypothetical protein